jgi:hypothetical protein
MKMEEVSKANVERLRIDAVVAKEIREDLRPILEAVCDILNLGRRSGFVVTWNLGPDQFGQHRVLDIAVVKPL